MEKECEIWQERGRCAREMPFTISVKIKDGLMVHRHISHHFLTLECFETVLMSFYIFFFMCGMYIAWHVTFAFVLGLGEVCNMVTASNSDLQLNRYEIVPTEVGLIYTFFHCSFSYLPPLWALERVPCPPKVPWLSETQQVQIRCDVHKLHIG